MVATVSDLSRVVYSGDARVDALLDGPAIWNFWPDGRNVLYYTFDVSNGSVVDQQTQGPVSPFNTSQQQAARAILQHAADLTGIQFVEVASSAMADVHFSAYNLSGSATAGLASTFYSYSYQSDGVLTRLNAESIVSLDNVEHAGINTQPVTGSAGYEVLLHEVGHMLGLAHPFDSPRPLAPEQDHTDNTVMSYTWRGTNKSEFQPYDVLALDWIYGRDGVGGAWGFNSTNGPSLVFDVPPASFVGTEQADVFISMPASESFDGAGGLDGVVFDGDYADYALTRQSVGWQIADRLSARDGTDTIVRVERLYFANHAVALDLDGAAGTAARLMGAVVGASTVGNKEWVGLVIGTVDSGMPYFELASLALQAILGRAPGNAQVVAHIYANLFHSAPDSITLQSLTALLDSGAYTQADLVQYASALDVNAVNIDLVGLSARGLEFVPIG